MLVEKDRPFYSVVQVAEILDMSTDRLRTYDEEYLVAPARGSRNKKRLYSELDVEWLKNLRALIAKNKMNIYSFKMLLKLIYSVSDEAFNKFVKNEKDETWQIILQMKSNPNYEKLKSYYSK